ncbi:MAG: tetratricopeptide repeat protein [Pseudomonadota bacterium]
MKGPAADWDRIRQRLGALIAARDWPAAEGLLRRSAGRADAPAAIHHNLGQVLAEQGRAEEAGRCFKRATDVAPDYAAAWFALGRCHGQAGRLPEAAEALLRAAELTPREPELQRMAARTCTATGAWVGAAACFARLLALRPGDAEALVGRYKATSEARLPEAEAARAALLAVPALRGKFLSTTIRLSAGRLPLRPT